MSEEGLVRLNVEIPRDLWKRAKMAAVQNDTDLRTLVIAALNAVLPPAVSGAARQVGPEFARRLKKMGEKPRKGEKS